MSEPPIKKYLISASCFPLMDDDIITEAKNSRIACVSALRERGKAISRLKRINGNHGEDYANYICAIPFKTVEGRNISNGRRIFYGLDLLPTP